MRIVIIGCGAEKAAAAMAMAMAIPMSCPERVRLKINRISSIKMIMSEFYRQSEWELCIGNNDNDWKNIQQGSS